MHIQSDIHKALHGEKTSHEVLEALYDKLRKTDTVVREITDAAIPLTDDYDGETNRSCFLRYNGAIVRFNAEFDYVVAYGGLRKFEALGPRIDEAVMYGLVNWDRIFRDIDGDGRGLWSKGLPSVEKVSLFTDKQVENIGDWYRALSRERLVFSWKKELALRDEAVPYGYIVKPIPWASVGRDGPLYKKETVQDLADEIIRMLKLDDNVEHARHLLFL